MQMTEGCFVIRGFLFGSFESSGSADRGVSTAVLEFS
jgi:hypothetical protein